jgi:hypothetical protein
MYICMYVCMYKMEIVVRHQTDNCSKMVCVVYVAHSTYMHIMKIQYCNLQNKW